MRNSVARVLVALILLVVSGTSSIGVAGASPSVTAQAGLVASASGGYDNPEHAYDTVAVSKLVNASLHAGAANLDGIAGNSLLKAVTTLYDSPANFVAPNPLADGLLGAGDDVVVLGRQADTAVAQGWPGHVVLDTPGWSLQLNDDFIAGAIAQGRSIYVASPLDGNLVQTTGRFAGEPTIFARELQQLADAGYTRVGDYLVPPS